MALVWSLPCNQRESSGIVTWPLCASGTTSAEQTEHYPSPRPATETKGMTTWKSTWLTACRRIRASVRVREC